MDEVIVTASRAGWEELSETPAVSITRSGDFLLQQIRLVNDTRDKKAPHDAIHETIAAMLARKGKSMQLGYGILCGRCISLYYRFRLFNC